MKHELGDWLPSPGALWGALKGSIDALRDSGSSPASMLNTVPGGSSPGSGSPGRPEGTPDCIGCITPPGYSPQLTPMPDLSKVARVAQ